jgi:hypothetical protein
MSLVARKDRYLKRRAWASTDTLSCFNCVCMIAFCVECKRDVRAIRVSYRAEPGIIRARLSASRAVRLPSACRRHNIRRVAYPERVASPARSCSYPRRVRNKSTARAARYRHRYCARHYWRYCRRRYWYVCAEYSLLKRLNARHRDRRPSGDSARTGG